MADDSLTPMQDGRVIHTMKEMPAWCVLAIFDAAFLIAWYISPADFIPRLIDGITGALLLSLQRKPVIPDTSDPKVTLSDKNTKEEIT